MGYYTAIIAEVVGQNGSVAASEVNADLARRAQENLCDYPNVSVHSGDGATFDPGECDAILVNAGVTHPLPLWMDRLRDAARMVFPLTMAVSATRGMGLMIRIVRHGRGFSAEIVTPVGIYSATGVRDPEREPLLKTAMTTGIIRKLKSARRDVHDRNDTCIVHGPDVCLTSVAVT
jgi:protein-L-isoaspartate(D-aspartate) O-methyltransferase